MANREARFTYLAMVGQRGWVHGPKSGLRPTDLSQVSVWASSAIIDSRATGPHSKCALVFPVMSGRFPEKP